MSFNATLYAKLQAESGAIDEHEIRDLVASCGGHCGEVEVGRSTVTTETERIQFTNYTLPVFDEPTDCYCGGPVEYVYLKEERQSERIAS